MDWLSNFKVKGLNILEYPIILRKIDQMNKIVITSRR